MAQVRVVEPLEWAQFKPPLRDATIRIDSRSRAWVAVHDRAEHLGQRFDLLSKEGVRLASIRLAAGEQLVGFGIGVLYASRSDEDGLVYLRRYQLP